MGNLHAVAWTNAHNIKDTRVCETVELPFLWGIKRWPRLAGGPSAGLKLHRRRLHAPGDVAVNQPKGRVFLLILLDIARIESRQLDDVVDASDVARFKTFGFPSTFVEFVFPPGFHQIEELLVLERPDFIGRPFPACIGENIRYRV